MKKLFLILSITLFIVTALPVKAWVLIAPTYKKAPTTQPTAPSPTPTSVIVGGYTPVLTQPSDASVLQNYPRTVSIQWANDGWTSHVVEITCDYCYSLSPWASTVAVGSSNTNEYTITLPGDNMYRVRVQGFGPNGRSAWSSFTHFSFKT